MTPNRWSRYITSMMTRPTTSLSRMCRGGLIPTKKRHKKRHERHFVTNG